MVRVTGSPSSGFYPVRWGGVDGYMFGDYLSYTTAALSTTGPNSGVGGGTGAGSLLGGGELATGGAGAASGVVHAAAGDVRSGGRRAGVTVGGAVVRLMCV